MKLLLCRTNNGGACDPWFRIERENVFQVEPPKCPDVSSSPHSGSLPACLPVALALLLSDTSIGQVIAISCDPPSFLISVLISSATLPQASIYFSCHRPVRSTNCCLMPSLLFSDPSVASKTWARQTDRMKFICTTSLPVFILILFVCWSPICGTACRKAGQFMWEQADFNLFVHGAGSLLLTAAAVVRQLLFPCS